MMKKWKVGAYYMKGFSSVVAGYVENELEIFKLIDMDDERVTLFNIETNETLIIDQDDRYGRYPLLDNKKIEQLEEAYDSYVKRVQILREAMKLMNKEGLRDNR